MSRVMLRSPSRMLLLHFGGLSELLYALPAWRALRKHLPDVWITVLAPPEAGELLALSEITMEVLVLERWQMADLLLPWIAYDVAHVAADVRKRRYDVLVDFHPSPQTALLALAAGVRSRLSAVRPSGWLGMVFAPCGWDAPHRHLVDRYVDALRLFGVTSSDRRPRLRTEAQADARAERWLRAHGIGQGELLIGLCPHPDAAEAAWPRERFFELAERLRARFPVHLLGVAWGRERIRFPRSLYEVRPRSVRDLASILARCTLMLSADAGPGHMAAALGVPTVMLGCEPARRPLGAEHWVLERAQARRCSIEHVLDIVGQMLGRSRTDALFRS